MDNQGNPVTDFTGSVSITIGHNGGLVLRGTLSGTKTVPVWGSPLERVPVTVDETYAMCQRLAAAGFFVGQSSGAYLAGVEHVARRERQGRFVTLFNDLGERYFSTRLWDA